MLYNILCEINDKKCNYCNAVDDKKRVLKVMKKIKKIFYNMIIPDRKPTNYDNGKNIKIMAYRGGYNNCRDLAIRRFRKFTKISEEQFTELSGNVARVPEKVKS
jgi:hypothetical protein